MLLKRLRNNYKKRQRPTPNDQPAVPWRNEHDEENDEEITEKYRICQLSTQTARTIATCVECSKPRVVYSKQKVHCLKYIICSINILLQEDFAICIIKT